MRFEFDPRKSAMNREKHGVDLVEAQSIWRDENRLELPARTSGEARFATLGKLGGDVWVAIWTPRGAAIRIISARRARGNERKLYEG